MSIRITNPAGGATGPQGPAGSEGLSAYAVAVAAGFTGTASEWLSSLVGPQGDTGNPGADSTVPGPDGLSAYEVAVASGFSGTQAEWLTSLIGDTGETGATGATGPAPFTLTGPYDNGVTYSVGQAVEYNGSTWVMHTYIGGAGYTPSSSHWTLLVSKGDTGESAYANAVANGFVGSQAEWQASLEGPQGEPGLDGSDGLSAFEVAEANGFIGTQAEWLSSLIGADGADGSDGLSAYDLAVADGFVGSSSEWLASLIGETGATGDTGASAYAVAVANGFVGTEAAWLTSLIGETGSTGAAGADGDKYHTTSTTELTLASNGNVTLTVETELDYSIAQTVIIAHDSLHHMHGEVVSYNHTTGSLTVALNNKTGVGTYTSWEVNLDGAVGIQGEPGLDGSDGSDGLSAYEVAVANGFTGTQAEWLTSLIGETGATGNTGLSAYEVAVANGFVGSENDWLASLEGPQGETGLTGNTGLSAYEQALSEGFVGTLAEWLTSLIGETGATGAAGSDGSDGLSAYELAVANGFTGSEAEWLTSLIGATGSAGLNGKTVLNGLSVPAANLGTVGDFYIATDEYIIYGPKQNTAAIEWNEPTTISGSGAPSSGTGATGDIYVDTAAVSAGSGVFVYGPKTSGGSWPTPDYVTGNGLPDTDGVEGDYYLDLTSNPYKVYGPRFDNYWPDSTSIVGPQGAPAVFTGQGKTVYVDIYTGSDTTGDGTAAKPYATIAYALTDSDLSGSVNSNLILGPGTHTCPSGLVIPKNLHIKGASPGATTIAVTGSVTLATSGTGSWAGANAATGGRGSLDNVTLTATTGVSLNFLSASSLYGTFAFNRVIVGSSTTFALTGMTAGNLVYAFGCLFTGAVTLDGTEFNFQTSDFYSTVTANAVSSAYIAPAYGATSANIRFIGSNLRGSVTVSAATGVEVYVDLRTSVAYATSHTVTGDKASILASPSTFSFSSTITTSSNGAVEYMGSSRALRFADSNAAEWTSVSANWDAYPVSVQAALNELASRVRALEP